MNINLKYRWSFITGIKSWRLLYIIIAILTASCDDFVEVDLPKNQITSEAVFQDVATARAAISNIYLQMRKGVVVSKSMFMGWYSDELDNFRSENNFFDHAVTASNATVSGWWRGSYNLIYAANDVIEGVANSTTLSSTDKNQLMGEALFIRAFLHSQLVELLGPIPYISTTDYIANSTVSRISVEIVYSHIIEDLKNASDLLKEDISNERLRVYEAVADALLARVYLYTEQWALSEVRASKVIANSDFVLEPDLNKIFLKDGSGTIWQLGPSFEGENTQYGRDFILFAQPTSVALSDAVLEAFEPNDLRASNWVGNLDTWYYPFKYKEANNTDISLEYPIIFRLAEQYLIRAEARVEQNKLTEGQSDLNIIRTRAGLPNTTAASKDALLNAILDERQVELFTEHGHRWFDLKRTGKASEVLSPLKPSWRDTDTLLPVPESDILLNPNLLPQNDGYQ